MLHLILLLHLFLGSTLAGVGVIVALLLGADSLFALLGAAGVGFVLAFPLSALIAKKING